MFDDVASRYDLTNDILSLGQARSWRRTVAYAVAAELGFDTADVVWVRTSFDGRLQAEAQRALREGRWQVALGNGLEGKTLGVLGLGNLGKRVARVAAAFGMVVIAWSSNLDAERAAEAGATAVTKSITSPILSHGAPAGAASTSTLRAAISGTASTIRSSAARLDSRLGAKPPSSPRPVDSPLSCSTFLRAW